jgi:hypothetical protein
MKKSNLQIYFVFNVFTCCLLHNLLKYENETNISQLLWFIKLEATLDEGIEIHVQVNVTKDLGVQTHIEGEEKLNDTLRKQLIKYLSRQQNITRIICKV